MSEMTLRRALSLALMALDDVADRYRGDPDWRQAYHVLSRMRKREEIAEQPPAPRTTAEAIFQFIVRYKREHDGLSPTLREIMEEVGICSTSTVTYHLRRLERQGLIRYRHGRYGCMVVGGEWQPPSGR